VSGPPGNGSAITEVAPVVGDCDFLCPVGVVIAGAGSAALGNRLGLTDVVATGDPRANTLWPNAIELHGPLSGPISCRVDDRQLMCLDTRPSEDIMAVTRTPRTDAQGVGPSVADGVATESSTLSYRYGTSIKERNSHDQARLRCPGG
jgi:hypothetical protein